MEFAASSGNTLCRSFPGWNLCSLGMERSPFPSNACPHIRETHGQWRMLDNVCQWMELRGPNLLYTDFLPARVRVQRGQGWDSTPSARAHAKLVLPFRTKEILLIMAFYTQL